MNVKEHYAFISISIVWQMLFPQRPTKTLFRINNHKYVTENNIQRPMSINANEPEIK